MYHFVPFLPYSGKEPKKITLQINTLQVIKKADLLPCIKEYLTGFVKNILRTYQATTLSECGSIYFLCSKDDTQTSDFPVPLKDIPFEYCERIHLNNSHEEVALLHGCYILNNDTAIDFFGLESIFDTETLNAFKENEKQE